MRVLDRGDQLAQVGLHLLGRARAVDELAASYSCSAAGPLERELGPKRSWTEKCPRPQRRPRAASRAPLDSSRTIAAQRAGAVAEHQLEELSPSRRRRVAPRTSRACRRASRPGTPHLHASEDRVAPGRTDAKTALITGGTGGLGAAVTARLLDDGWRVVVPWIVEHELERVDPRRLELVQADLFDPDEVGERGQCGRGRRRRAAPRGGQPGRRLSRRQARARDPDRAVRGAVPAQPAAHLSGHSGGAAAPVGRRRRLDRVRGNPRGAAAVRRRRRLRGLQGGGDRVRPRRRGRVPRRRHPLQRDPAQRDRHARQPRRDAQRRPRPVGQAGRDRRRDRAPAVRRRGCRPAARWSRSTGAPDRWARSPNRQGVRRRARTPLPADPGRRRSSRCRCRRGPRAHCRRCL